MAQLHLVCFACDEAWITIFPAGNKEGIALFQDPLCKSIPALNLTIKREEG
jgi:hypothetical protein